MIKKLFSRKHCEHCSGSYYQSMTAEDKKKYLVPFKPRYCPHCGRRLGGLEK